ncbi:hypothetical protein [Kordiimonas sp. SCSIO 12610]|uniref:hypothetical protein n=1 Tax=Kordiimonas sp. SCSIO 12610 TaxID=2829597 RepID=UPI00210E676C|nr:hypothetical protein [Kordiimonas sp. SCSIO 12610]UTW56489.1 hypothetical protein KFF44_06200 [Kordiimonas sp. SCSIO 12610]
MNIRFITPTLHGVLDYGAALGLIVFPFLLSLSNQSELVHWFSVIAGVGLITYSLLTDYKFSVKGVLSYKMHLVLDSLASAAFVALAFLHNGTAFTFGYCLIMAGGVIAVIGLSGRDEDSSFAGTTVSSNSAT